MLGFDALAAWFRRQERAVQGALALTAISRLWLAATDHSVYWPDEIYQSIEPAHRLAFGYGLLPWEFRDGARSWAFPTLLAVPLKILGLLHVHSGLAYVIGARLVMVLLAVAAAGVAIDYARRLGGKNAALIAAFALALFPPLLVYSHRTLQEAASAPLIALVPLLLMLRNPRAATQAGLAVGIASVLRFQCGVLAAGFLIGLIFERRWEDVRAYLKMGAIVALASGLLDWITWGAPFHSFVTYFQFNLI
ncbi:MAG TPA: glycosyltransferase family 39 protein, partial [Polyangiaceae bacterium]|nr:glycosyltransferase family 39 protein [Polyangiaceae bacterium]